MTPSGDQADIESDLGKRIQVIIGSAKPVAGQAELYLDLGIAGDDAFELLEGIARDYSVTFDRFSFSDYFPNETEALWYHWKSLIGFPDRSRKSFTVNHLIAIVERGEWFVP